LVIICVFFVDILTTALLPRDEQVALVPQIDDAEEADATLSFPRPTVSRTSSSDYLLTKDIHSPSSLWGILIRAATVDLYLSLKLVVDTVRDPLTRQVMAIFFTYTLAVCVSATTQQWASSTFHAKLADVDQVTSMEQIVSAVALLTLPLFSQYVLRPRLVTKQRVDFQLIILSLIIGVASALVMALAPSMLVYALGVAISALGVGLADCLRSFATTAVNDSEAVEKLYMSIRTVQSLGAIIGTPLWANIFLLILKSNGAIPPGTLFIVNGTILLGSLCLTLNLRHYR